MKRGEVWWVNFDPAIGGEIQKEWPAVIVSNDIANKLLNCAQVVPLTSNADRLYPSEADASIAGVQHKVMTDQITTVSKKRLANKMGKIFKSDLQAVERVMKVQLRLS